MIRANLKSLLSRKFRLALSALAIVLGVSFVSGAFVLTDTMGKAFDGLFSTVNAGTAVNVQPKGAGDGSDFSREQKLLPASLVDQVRHVSGVKYAEGSIYGYAQLVGKNGKAIGGNGPPTAGVNWGGGASAPTSIITMKSGRGPRAPNEVTIDAGLAGTSGYHTGDQVTVLTMLGQRRFTVVGVYGYRSTSSLGGSTTMAFTDPVAQQLMAKPGQYDSITVAADDGVGQAALRDRIAAQLPGNVEAVTGKQSADQQSTNVKSSLKFFSTFLLIFAGVALFVGAFLIFNTFSMLIAQRSKELALMRALGASKGQVLRSVVVESLLVGAFAGVVGLGAGILVAIGLRAGLGAVGVDLPTTTLVVSVRTVVVSLLVGIVVTVLAALLPARKASAVPPMAALRDVATPDGPTWRISALGAVTLLLGAAAMAYALLGSAALAFLGIGAVLFFIGVAALSPLASVPVTGLLGRLLARGTPGRLGRQNAMRNPRRTAATAAALMIGLALVSAIGVVGQSVKTSIRSTIDSTIGADFVLNSQTPGFSPAVATKVAGLPGVQSALPLSGGEVRLDGARTYVTAISARAIDDHRIVLKRQAGTLTGLRPGALLVAQKEAAKQHLHVGSTVRVDFPKGSPRDLRVAGTYEDNQLAGSYLLDSSAARQFQSPLAFAALVTKTENASAATVRHELDRATQDQATITVQDRSDFASSTAGQVDQLIAIIYVLLALSVLIAVLGIVNTLALSVLERTRELGLLRAIGMGRRQVRRMVRVESVLVAVFGGLLGVVVGVGLGVAVTSDLKDQGIGQISVPYAQLLVFVALAALAGVLAAVLPGRRAARLNVLSAIAAE